MNNKDRPYKTSKDLIRGHTPDHLEEPVAEEPTPSEKPPVNNTATKLAADKVGGQGTSKDINQALGTKADGAEADKVEKAIAATKLAGRAANRALAAGNPATAAAIDKVGDKVTKNYQKLKSAKDKVSGKNLMGKHTSPQQKKAATKKAGTPGKPQQNKQKNTQKSIANKAKDLALKGVKARAKGIKIAIAGVLASVMLLLIILSGGVSLSIDAQPGEESRKTSVSYLPGANAGDPNAIAGGWQDVALHAIEPQRKWQPPKQIPWTLITGIAAEQTDFGRFSPYDATDRDPNRQASPIIKRLAGESHTGGTNISSLVNADILNTGELNRTNMAWREQLAMKMLVDGGYRPEVAAGIVGNMRTESHTEPARAEDSYPFPSDRGWGLVQWTFSRNTAIVAAVKSELGDKYYTNNPSSLTDEEWLKLFQFQINYITHELNTTYSYVKAGLDAAKTPAEASYVFLAKYEVPANIAGNAPIRAAQADAIYDLYKRGGIEAIKNGEVAVNLTRAEAEYLTFNKDAWNKVVSGNVAKGDSNVAGEKTYPNTAQCPVDVPSPEIGGQPGQGVGPYLLSEDAADQARDAGYNPQSPCVGRWIARQLSDTAQKVNSLPNYTYHKYAPYKSEEESDKKAFQDNLVFWQEVVARSGLFASNQDYTEDCVLPADKNSDDTAGTYTKQIAYSFHCQFAQHPDLEIVKSATWKSSAKDTDSDKQKSRAKMVASFSTYTDRKEAELSIINEAFQVSYAANKWELEQCNKLSEDAQGLIPLTKAEAEKAGIQPAERCDSGKNAAAAAKLWVEGEKEKVSSRSTKEGPFAPAFGGWANISTALGSEDSKDFASFGKASSFSVNDKCRAYTSSWIKDVVGKHIGAGEDEGFSKYAKLNEDQREELLAKGREWSQDLGLFGKKAPWMSRECNGGDEKAYGELLGELAIELKDESRGDDTEKKAWDGFMNWAGLLAQRIPGEIIVGQTSLVPRLSPVSYKLPPVPVSADSVSLMILSKTGTQDGFAPLPQRAVEYAVFFGGLSKPFDSAGSLIGSLKELSERSVGGVSYGSGTSSSGWTTPTDAPLGNLAAGAGFGPRNIGVVNGLNTDVHYGVDFLATCGSPVYAAGSGEVVDITKDNGGGNVIRIKHDGADTLYVHMEEGANLVKVGDHVEAGQLISKAGNTGFSTGCHLHFEVRPENTPSWADFHKSVDPIAFFRERGIELGVDKHGKIAGAKSSSQSSVGTEQCPTALPEGAQSSVLAYGAANGIGIAELCRKSVAEARSPEAAKALLWAFDKVGKWWYSQPQRNQDGFADCSSIISRAYMAAGVPLYPEGTNAWVTGTFVSHPGSPQLPMSELKPGDWFEFEPGHIVFIIADGYVLHASQPGDQIRIDKFWTGSYNVGGYIDAGYFKK